jgi:hypothetical protein
MWSPDTQDAYVTGRRQRIESQIDRRAMRREFLAAKRAEREAGAADRRPGWRAAFSFRSRPV